MPFFVESSYFLHIATVIDTQFQFNTARVCVFSCNLCIDSPHPVEVILKTESLNLMEEEERSPFKWHFYLKKTALITLCEWF